MGTITALTPQVKRPERVNVFVDGAFACGLAASVAAGLSVGQSITDDDLQALAAREEAHQARERAVGLIARRPRSAAEITRYLRRHQYDEATVASVIAELTESKLIDDDAFAAYWVEQRDTFRPRSRLALRQELGQKGIERDIVSDALAHVDESDAARRIAQRQARRWTHLPQEEQRRKLTQALLRQGFPYDIVSEIVTEARLAREEENDD